MSKSFKLALSAEETECSWAEHCPDTAKSRATKIIEFAPSCSHPKTVPVDIKNTCTLILVTPQFTQINSVIVLQVRIPAVLVLARLHWMWQLPTADPEFDEWSGSFVREMNGIRSGPGNRPSVPYSDDP